MLAIGAFGGKMVAGVVIVTGALYGGSAVLGDRAPEQQPDTRAITLLFESPRSAFDEARERERRSVHSGTRIDEGRLAVDDETSVLRTGQPGAGIAFPFDAARTDQRDHGLASGGSRDRTHAVVEVGEPDPGGEHGDRKSTRLNSSHG